MSCVVTYNQQKYSEEYMRRKVGAVQDSFNNNINLRGNREMLSIMKEDNLVDTTDKEKYGMLSTTGNATILNRILKAAEGGLQDLSKLAKEELNKLRKSPGLTLSDDTVNEFGDALTSRDYIYEGMLEKLRRPAEQKAAEAGVSVEDMVDYENGEDLDDATEKLIREYNKKLFTADERRLYDSMRRIFKLSFPLSQRAGKVLSEDGFFADAADLANENVARAETSKEKWTKTWGKSKAAKLLREGLKKYAKIVSIDNILMKMGFEKGSAGFHVFWQAINVGKRTTEVQNAQQDGMMGELLRDKAIAAGTKFFYKHSYDKIQKEEIQFADKKVNMSIAEIIYLHLTLRQKDIAERFVYDKQRYDSAINNNEQPFPIRVREYGQRGEQKVVVSDATLQQVNDIATKPEYAELLKTVDTILEQQYQKVSDTLFILSGQRLPQIEKYFPTYQASEKLNDFQKQQRALEDLRYIKERKNGLTVLDVQDIFSMMHNYIHSTNYYANMSVPLRNAEVLLDKSKEAFSGDFEHFYGIYSKWLNGLKNNKGQLDYGDADKLVNKAYRLYYKGILGWNAPVVLKQPTSALHAWNYFGNAKYAKYMIDSYKYGFTKQKTILDEIVKHNPIIRMYMENVASPELGTLLQTGGYGNNGALVGSGIGGMVKKAGDLYVNKSLDLIRRFDLAARIGLWEASKQYVTDKFKLTEKDGSAYWSMVAEMHNQVMEDTQQTWDLMHRSELGRSENAFVRGFMMFSTQLQKHMSLLDKSVTNYTMYGRKQDRDALIRASLSVLVVQSALVALIDMGKDSLLGYDDEDEDKMKNLVARTLSNDLATIPFIGQLYANDIANAVVGSDLYTQPISTPILDVMQYGQEIIGDISDNDGLGDLVTGVWTEGSKYAGIPLAPFRQFEAYQKNQEE